MGARIFTHSRSHSLTHALAGTASRCSPARRAPGRSFLLCLLFAAQRPPSRRPARPRRRCGRAPGGGGGGQRGRDGAGVVAAARAGPQPLRHRPGRNHLRSSLLAPRPSPVLRQAGGAAGTRLRSSRLSPGLPRAAPTLRPPRQATLRQSRSHLLRVPGRG